MFSRPLALLAIFVVAIAFTVVAALGSGSASAGPDMRARGAVAVPADALAYASANADHQDAAWLALERLAQRVPGGVDAVRQVSRMVGADSANGRVLRAMGGDISVGLLGVDVAGGADRPTADAVLVATAADGPALIREFEAIGFVQAPAIDGAPTWEQGAYAATVEGSVVIVATSRATLRAAIEADNGSAPSLADQAPFKATLAQLPDDPLAIAYISPPRLSGLLRTAAALVPDEQFDGRPNATKLIADFAKQIDGVRGLGLAVGAEDGGLRIAVASDFDQAKLATFGASTVQSHVPTIVERVPADAIGFVVFRDLGPRLLVVIDALVAQSPQISGHIRSLENASDLSLRREIVPALSGQQAVVVLAGDRPRGALLLAPPAPAAADLTLVKAMRIVQAAGRGPDASGVTSGTISDLAVTWQPGSDLLAIGNAPQLAVAPELSVSQSGAYRAITSQAGVPDSITGLAYLDAARVFTQAKAKGRAVPSMASAIRGVVAWSTATSASVFIAIG